MSLQPNVNLWAGIEVFEIWDLKNPFGHHILDFTIHISIYISLSLSLSLSVWFYLHCGDMPQNPGLWGLGEFNTISTSSHLYDVM